MVDIGSGKGYPSSSLSNFAPHPFVIDEVECNSMEGFLQSLKFKEMEMQKHVCTLVGKKAKFKGKKKKWWKEQTLYWKGEAIPRKSIDYSLLIDKAYNELFKNTKFKKALLSTKGQPLKHSIGKSDKSKTVLTENEFVRILTKMRDQ